ncbi:MAG TPA: MFS transporter [Phototrophicaceae bacterium]|nr:MFS transporter [Phototrophicaceae bacterium]
MWRTEIRKHTQHNFIVNVLDGAFYGLGFGFTSYEAVIPLFITSLTDSKLLIGLITSMHVLGWQLPQLITAGRVARLKRYKPMVLAMTLNERVPYLPMALIALFITTIGQQWALLLMIGLVLWQSLGAGFTATAWQSMIGKIMPKERIGTFFGAQSAAANLLLSGSAIAAGFILAAVPAPYNFALCFLLTAIFMGISFGFLALTREPEHTHETADIPAFGWAQIKSILRRDINFRWYVVARIFSQVAWMAVTFFTVYAVSRFDASETTIGFLTGLLVISRAIANPLMGWLGDHWGHRWVYAAGAVMMALGAAIALFAPTLEWLYVAFALSGFSTAASWAIAMSFTLEFGTTAEKPLYIGLSNTLVAPITLLITAAGGGLADIFGFTATFGLSIVGGLVTAAVLVFFVHDPHPQTRETIEAVPAAIGD